MTAYSTLRQALRVRGSIATPWEVRTELDAYFASLRPSKGLGSGDFCVVDTKGNVRMMTRDQYTDMVHTRKGKKGRKICLICGEKNCGCKTTRKLQHYGGDTFESIHREAKQKSEFDANLNTSWAALVDEFAANQQRQEDENGYHGLW